MGKEETTISFGVVRIKDLAFEMDESPVIGDNLQSQVTFHNTMSILPELGHIDFTIDARFYTDKVESSTFLRGKVQTIFFIVDMHKFMIEGTNQIDLPHQALVAMFSIAVTHARALIAKATMGSKYDKLYLPLVNPSELLKGLLQGKE